MLARYHRQITQEALDGRFHPAGLQVIISANLAQDNIAGQIGHPEYHYDDNAFAAGDAYLEAQRQVIRSVIRAREDIAVAWAAFGRLIHAAQDFYSHSNYVSLWLEKYRGDPSRLAQEALVAAQEQIKPLDPAILVDPRLRSGRIYYPWEAFGFVPLLQPLMRRFLPRDSHLWMNLDHAGRGPLFGIALSAARLRTQHEFQQLAQQFSPEQRRAFAGISG